MFWLTIFSLLQIHPIHALWPQPTHLDSGDQVLWLDPALQVHLHCRDPQSVTLEYPTEFKTSGYLQIVQDGIQLTRGLWDRVRFRSKGRRDGLNHDSLTESAMLQAAVRETIESIHESRFVPWKFHKRHRKFEPDTGEPRHYVSSLEIVQQQCPREEGFAPSYFFGGDESYELFIEPVTARIQANSTIGVLRALETLKQLFYAHSSASGSYIPNAPLHIVDRPKWSHRGLSLDIARNPFYPEDVLRTIDVMATTKFSRLHVHATDSQSWPLDIPSLPGLAEKGAYHPGLVWTTADLEKIQRYGARKGVSVFVEIDMPGHTAAIAYSRPDLIAAFNELDWSHFAAEPLSGQLKLNSSAVLEFVDILLQDLLPRVGQHTTLYHAGGDEVNRHAYLLDETVRTDDPRILQPLLQNLFDRIIDRVIEHGLQPVVWEEMILDWNLSLPSAAASRFPADTLVQVWRNSERIQEVVERGYRVLFGDYHYWYLDCGLGQFLDPYPSGKSPSGVPFNTSGGRSSQLTKPYLDYCSPFHNWRHMYVYDPLANISKDLQHLLAGGEVLMWSEQTDHHDIDIKLWPRAAAAAEVLWAGPREETMLEDASKRLGEWRERVVQGLGVSASPVHMTWCHMEGGCNL